MFSALHIMVAEYKSILYKPVDGNNSTFTICNENGDDQTFIFPGILKCAFHYCCWAFPYPSCKFSQMLKVCPPTIWDAVPTATLLCLSEGNPENIKNEKFLPTSSAYLILNFRHEIRIKGCHSTSQSTTLK